MGVVLEAGIHSEDDKKSSAPSGYRFLRGELYEHRDSN